METPHIPGYRIEKAIGKGAMSTVFLGIQESLERRVAIKILSPRLASDPTFNKRFVKEARIIGRLGHPHIVTIFDAGSYEDLSYIAMEYLEGATLKERIKAGLTPEQAVKILRQVAQALGCAHQQNCIHRDIKPANIMFRDPEMAVLSDFGIAKNLEDKTQLTAVGWRIGTPNYMSPEQSLARPLDGRSDLYSLGVVFYEMLTGTRPYQGADAFETAMLHIKSPTPILPEPLSRFQPILNRLLAKKPEDRFANSEELLQALDQLDTRPISAKARTSQSQPLRQPPFQSSSPSPSIVWPALFRRWLPWVLVAVLSGLGVLLAYRLLSAEPSRHPSTSLSTPRQPGTTVQ
ncbi:MAG TPA: serine/threonine-protein kinase [Candidatus Competibacter sp.]|nr:serine/threonine-protein kinase [Candidatus Competibacter sp.]